MARHRARRQSESMQIKMLRLICRVAEKAQVKMGIGGGIAVSAQGFRRDTVDVDAFFHYRDRQSVVRALRVLGSRYVLEMLDDAHWIAVPPNAAPDERIDLMFATGDPEESAIELSQKKIFRGVEAPIFPVEWIIITKYLADRNDPKDWLDIWALYQRGAYDVKQIVKRLKQMGNQEEAVAFPKFIERLVAFKKK